MSSMLVIVFLVLAALATSQPECENAEQQMKTIHDEIKEIERQSQNHCSDYGTEKQDGHQHMESEHHNLRLHTVCVSSGDNRKKLYVKAIVGPQDLDEGTDVTQAARKKIQSYSKPCVTDHSGHIIGKEIGGPGELYNLFAQSASLNQRSWRSVTEKITDHLKKTNKEHVAKSRANKRKFIVERTATIEVAFIYADAEYELRPSSFDYKFKLYEDGTKIKTISGTFKNVNHDFVDLLSCEIDFGRQLLILVKPIDERHSALQTCNVADQYKHLFGEPALDL